MLPRKPTHEGTLANGREADEPDTGHARSCDVEASSASTTSARRRCQQLALQLRELGLELTQMKRRGLVLLSPSHL